MLSMQAQIRRQKRQTAKAVEARQPMCVQGQPAPIPADNHVGCDPRGRPDS
jgi:hypothetical protein